MRHSKSDCQAVETQQRASTEMRVGRSGPGRHLLLSLGRVMLLAVFLWGCASAGLTGEGKNVLATVEGMPVTEEDLYYQLRMAHQMKQEASQAGTLDVTKFIEKIIDDRLIAGEARRMRMGQKPGVKQAVEKYVLNESVSRLYVEEIAGKVSVTEEEIDSHYRRNHERFSIGIIESGSKEEAAEILELLEGGGDFTELVRKYSTHSSRAEGGKVLLTRQSLAHTPGFEEAVLRLGPGEFSGVIKERNGYYILKLYNREEPPENELQSMRGHIEKELRKQKEKARSEEYLKLLREKAEVKIDRELLSSIQLEGKAKELSQDTRELAKVDGSVLTVGEFAAMASSGKSREDALNNWVDIKVVDHEALGRQYDLRGDFRDKLERYEMQLLKNAFIEELVLPEIEISEEALKSYHASHREDYTGPVRFKLQQIASKTEEEAREVLDRLKNGADFSWLARMKSSAPDSRDDGDAGYKKKSELPVPVQEIVEGLGPGELSPILQVGPDYVIIRLQDRKEGELMDFNEVKGAVYKACFKEQFEAILNKYVAQLKPGAEITINEDAVRSIEKRLSP